MKKKRKLFQTKDLNVASYLHASSDVKLVRTQRDSSNVVWFSFSPRKDAEVLADTYFFDVEVSISPKRLFNAQRDLKNLIFSGGVYEY